MLWQLLITLVGEKTKFTFFIVFFAHCENSFFHRFFCNVFLSFFLSGEGCLAGGSLERLIYVFYTPFTRLSHAFFVQARRGYSPSLYGPGTFFYRFWHQKTIKKRTLFCRFRPLKTIKTRLC